MSKNPRQLMDPKRLIVRVERNELVRARNRGILLLGMSRQDVEHILGRPDDVNTYVGSA
ncbi:hypothetical protein FIU88_17125 [Halomonas sp. THAF12]|uniref:hypothetical protein n=1 Tax=Halomonas sp. THAF12 TaxID=2587849 RepID=UPI0012A953D8|nr:hypothetical protein [Halomonas sp. THAF12]QFT86670.1 hypothetical protein FIU88_17125 [Halomonas sp. THAF12]